MRRLLLCTLLAAMLPLALAAQTQLARLDIGRREPLPTFFEYSRADGGLVTLGKMKLNTSRYQGVTKYNASFEKEWEAEVLEQNGRMQLDFLAVMGENIFVFVSEFFPRDNAIRTWYTQLDLEGNAIKEREVIAELKNEKQHRTDLNYVTSVNKKKLLCYKILNTQGRPETILYYLFDQAQGFESSGEITLPFTDDEIRINQIQVSNQGTVFLLGKHYSSGHTQDPDSYTFRLFRHEPGNPSLEAAEISSGEAYITDLSFRIDRDENLFLAGFYSNTRVDAIAGTVFQRLSPDLQTEVQSTQKFSEEFMSKFLSARQIERGRELKNFYLDNIIMRSDGGVLLVAEKFYVSYNSYIDVYGNWIDNKVYHYDEIIVNSVAADGSLEWSAVAPKTQSSENREFLSYNDVVSGASLYLIYSYAPRRMAETVYVNRVDENGNVEERTMLLDGAQTQLLLTDESGQISNNEALLIYYEPRSRVFTVAKYAFD